MGPRNTRLVRIVAGVALTVVASAWLAAGGIGRPSDVFAAPAEDERSPAWLHARSVREAALQRAAVWRPPGKIDLGANPPDPTGLLSRALVTCRFLPRPSGGTSPKFDCVLEDGEVVKVKYGRNPEVHAEAAATRLVAALGFGADRIYLVERFRCYACPRYPFQTIRLLALAGARGLFEQRAAENLYTDFEWVAVERQFEGLPIVTEDATGWGWFELPRESTSGATRAELDALRLIAVFLAHWDNKTENQRLVCVADADV